MTKHTPGPWEVFEGEVRATTWPRDLTKKTFMGPRICTLDRGSFENHGPVTPVEHDANARLIAAAPELLAACEAMCAKHQSPETIEAAYVLMRAATAKATE